jgi:hypothetical protein
MKSIPIIASVDVSSRRKRRAATALAIDLLEKIRLAEEQYQSNIPLNLQESAAYAAAEETIDSLIDAILLLDCAFD